MKFVTNTNVQAALSVLNGNVGLKNQAIYRGPSMEYFHLVVSFSLVTVADDLYVRTATIQLADFDVEEGGISRDKKGNAVIGPPRAILGTSDLLVVYSSPSHFNAIGTSPVSGHGWLRDIIAEEARRIRHRLSFEVERASSHTLTLLTAPSPRYQVSLDTPIGQLLAEGYLANPSTDAIVVRATGRFDRSLGTPFMSYQFVGPDSESRIFNLYQDQVKIGIRKSLKQLQTGNFCSYNSWISGSTI